MKKLLVKDVLNNEPGLGGIGIFDCRLEERRKKLETLFQILQVFDNNYESFECMVSLENFNEILESCKFKIEQ